MTVCAIPPRSGDTPFENWCPLCGSRCMISLDPNRMTLRYECDGCTYEHDVPKRLPRMVVMPEDGNEPIRPRGLFEEDE